MRNYDAIVIGGGLGGMTAALYLASRGRKTLVLEQNHQTGGNMAGFRRGAFYFDGGDQSFESLGIVFPVLEELGVLDKIKWHKARFRMVSPDFDFFVDSFDSVEESLRAAFPQEDGIGKLFREIREVSAFIAKHSTPWEFPLLHDFSWTRLPPLLPALPRLLRWLSWDYRKKACSVIRNPALRGWFSEIGYYKMPYIFFAGFWHLWMHDYWYPEGGMQNLYDALSRRLRELGGEILFSRRVVKIEAAGRRAAGLVLNTDEVFTARHFVYAGDYIKLVRDIAPEIFRPAFAKKACEAKLTEELLTVYLGLSAGVEELHGRLGAQHVFYFPSYAARFPDAASPRDVHSRMWLLFNHFGRENPGAAPEDSSSATLQTYTSWDWENRWGTGGADEKDGKIPRTENYRRLKAEAAAGLVSTAENIFPGLKEKILYQDAGTPLSTERFTLNSRGSSGGWCYGDKESLVFRKPAKNLIKTPLENLFACGHYSLWPGGVISAALSGKIAGNLAAGRKPLEKL